MLLAMRAWTDDDSNPTMLLAFGLIVFRSLRPSHISRMVAMLDLLYERLQGYDRVLAHCAQDTRFCAGSLVRPS